MEQIKVCNTCGIMQIGECFYWSTGKAAKSEDLAGLVCQTVKNSKDLSIRAKYMNCINKNRDAKGGDTWEKRRDFLDVVEKDIARGNDIY